MRTLLAITATAFAVGCNQPHTGHTTGGHAHGGEHHTYRGHDASAHTLEVRSATPATAGEQVQLSLVVRGDDGSPVTAFETVHGERVHLIIVREGLDQFTHLHPAVSPSGELTFTHSFPVGGTYRLFADYHPTSGKPTVATGSIAVSGPTPTTGALVTDVPGEVRGDGLAAGVTVAPAPSGHGVRVEFRVRDERGQAITDLEPYLGELGHMVLLSEDASRYVHVHPAGGDKGTGTVAFEAHFPAPGLYKGWGQFQRAGRVYTLPLVTRAEK